MNQKTVALLGAMLIGVLCVSGCAREPDVPAGGLSAAELLENPPVQVFGQVSVLGELMCTCFFLSSNGYNLHVWYDTRVEDDQTIRPAVDVEGTHNGDWVLVTGELKEGGIHYSPNDFWVSEITSVR